MAAFACGQKETTPARAACRGRLCRNSGWGLGGGRPTEVLALRYELGRLHSLGLLQALILSLRIADGFCQHLAQLSLGLCGFPLGWLPLCHKHYVGMREGELNPNYDGQSCTSGTRITDLTQTSRHVREVPCVDGSGLARTFFTSQAWSVQPCVRPLSAVHMTAGHNALRGSGPGQNRAFDSNAMAQVGCPDRRIDRLCITCCSPSQPSHHAGYPARSRSPR